MVTPNNQSGSHENILERTGIMEDSEIQIEDTPVTPEVKPTEEQKGTTEEVKPEVKPEEKPKGENEDEPVKPTRSTNSDRPLKALFTQIKEIRADIASIKKGATPAEKAEIKAVDDALGAVATKHNLDAEGLAEIAKVLESNIMKNLEDSGKLKVSPEVQNKLDELDRILTERSAQAEQSHFDGEWTKLVPEIQKQFPNASANELAEAKKVMDELSHTKEFHDKDLDYVLFKNQSKFSTILKLAKGKKAGESPAREVEVQEENEDDIDLDPENIDPEKMGRYQKHKIKSKSGDAEIMG